MCKTLPIATIKKNSREELRLSVDVFKGQCLFNMRVFFDAKGGSMRPGKSSLASKLDKLEEFAGAVTTGLMAAKSKGFLATTKLTPGENAIIVVKAQFGLSTKLACEAAKEAALIRARAH